jgi:FtsP/CotA-like multicopper oxidase with cupredoxin domain
MRLTDMLYRYLHQSSSLPRTGLVGDPLSWHVLQIFYIMKYRLTISFSKVRNPGAFFMHCHIDPHLTGGMA